MIHLFKLVLEASFVLWGIVELVWISPLIVDGMVVWALTPIMMFFSLAHRCFVFLQELLYFFLRLASWRLVFALGAATDDARSMVRSARGYTLPAHGLCFGNRVHAK